MITREWIGTAHVPGGAEMRLMREGDEFTIVLENTDLMSTRVNASEEALATMTCARLRDPAAPQLLIGGYGMGFTLRAALRMLGPRASVIVSELVPEVIEWARGPMTEITAACLNDARVTLVYEDVGIMIQGARAAYDAILLDVDNGPDGLIHGGNDYLYSGEGLEAAMAALKPGGTLSVWSAWPDEGFTQRLRTAGFAVEQVIVNEAADGAGASHVIWFAIRPLA